jgi:hypothetical protein
MKKTNCDCIAYCGLRCDTCPPYTGVIADLATNLKKEIKNSKMGDILEKVPMPGMEHFKECMSTLDALSKQRCGKMCKEGGGWAECPIRLCCKEKKFDGCWECKEIKDCNNLGFLRQVHGDLVAKRLRKIKKLGKKEYLKTNPKS